MSRFPVGYRRRGTTEAERSALCPPTIVLACVLACLACLLTSCESVTEHYFTGTLTKDGARHPVTNERAPLGRTSATPTMAEWRYFLERSDCVLMVRAPRRESYVGCSVSSPADSLGVFVLSGRDIATNRVDALTPLTGSVQFQNVSGESFEVDAASADTGLGVSGRMTAKRHLEFHPLVALGLVTGLGHGAEPPSAAPGSAANLCHPGRAEANQPPAAAGSGR